MIEADEMVIIDYSLFFSKIIWCQCVTKRVLRSYTRNWIKDYNKIDDQSNNYINFKYISYYI